VIGRWKLWQKKIVDLKAEETALADKKKSKIGTDPIKMAYDNYQKVIDSLIKAVTDDTNKTNKYSARLSIGDTSITGSELRCNILFNFIKEYFEDLNPDEVYDYLDAKFTAAGDKMTTDTKVQQKAKFDNIIKYTKDVAIPSDNKENDWYPKKDDELLTKHYFRRLKDPLDNKEKKKRMWETSEKFQTEKLIFPYEDFFSLMNAWFKDGVGNGTIRGNNYPAFTDEATNPFKKAGLLDKNFELFFDPANETPKTDYKYGGKWYLNDNSRRTSVKFKNLQEAIVEFYSFFLLL